MRTRSRTTIIVAVEQTPTRTRAVMLAVVEVEHDDRQLALALDATPIAAAPLAVRSAA